MHCLVPSHVQPFLPCHRARRITKVRHTEPQGATFCLLSCSPLFHGILAGHSSPHESPSSPAVRPCRQ